MRGLRSVIFFLMFFRTPFVLGGPVPISPAPPLESVYAKAALVVRAERREPCTLTTTRNGLQFRILRTYKTSGVPDKSIIVRLPGCREGTFFLFLNSSSGNSWEPSDRFWSVWPSSNLQNANADQPGLKLLLRDAATGITDESEANKLATLHLIEGANDIDPVVEDAVAKYRFDSNVSIATTTFGILVKTGKAGYIEELIDYLDKKGNGVPTGEIQSATSYFASDQRLEDRMLLERLARIKQNYVRMVALQSLRRIGSKESVPAIAPLIYDDNDFTRFQAVAFLTEVLNRGDAQCASLAGYDNSKGACLDDWRTWWKTTGSLQYSSKSR